MKTVVVCCMIALAPLAVYAEPVPARPSHQVFSLTTTVYEIHILKSGRVDVVLANGDPVATGAFPMIQFDGEDRPHRMTVRGDYSERIATHDCLGQGNGALLKKKECEWVINSYETQPFFTVRVSYLNTTRKPVKVKALFPWCVGAPGKGALTLGPGTDRAVFLQNQPGLFSTKRIPTIETGDVTSLGNLAGYDPVSQRSLIAGFLTAVSSFPVMRLARGDKDPESIRLFRAECPYDPPIEVAPGERLSSELLYIAIGENSPFVGLERFGDAMAHMSDHSDAKRTIPNSWDSWSTKYRTDITEKRMLSALNFVDKNLKRYGWTHFAIDDGWEKARGDWDPNPKKFPHGMKWLADQIHAKGMTAGIWIAPFVVDPKTEFAKQHPDWLVKADGPGKDIVGNDARILDVTAPGAYDYVKTLMAKLSKQWGYDVIKADYTYYLLFMSHWNAPNLTRAEVLRLGMRAIRAGIGDNTSLMSYPPGITNGPYIDSLRIGEDTAPIWRKAPNRWPWGCVDALTNAARRYYFAPYNWLSDPDCAFFAHEDTRKRWGVLKQPPLTINQSVAWFTGAALTGGVVEIGDCFNDLTPTELAILKRLLPVPEQPARPVDLFDGGPPRIWSLPIHSPIGDWEIVGVFNWDAHHEHDVPLDFAQLGMNSSELYTVFDFWADKYYGTARGTLKVSVGPGSVRLLGLKPYKPHPMFLSTNRHFTQGATDFTALSWDQTARRLSGTFKGVADTDYELKVLAPESYQQRQTTVSAGPAKTSRNGKVLTITFHCGAAAPVNWSVDF